MKLITATGASIVLLFLLVFILRTDFTKTERRYKIKKVLDVIIYMVLYIFIISWNMFDENKIYISAHCVLFISIFAYILSITLIIKYKVNPKSIRRANIKYTLISVISECLIAISLTHYGLYLMNPNWYKIETSLNTIFEVVFEFLYFTFTLMTTSGGETIVAVGIVPRIVQMVHVGVFILFLCDAINELVKSKAQSNKDD